MTEYHLGGWPDSVSWRCCWAVRDTITTNESVPASEVVSPAGVRAGTYGSGSLIPNGRTNSSPTRNARRRSPGVPRSDPLDSQCTGLDTSSLSAIDVRIADLPGATLRQAVGNTIWLDIKAAGWGWFVDPKPWDDSEFTTPGNQGEEHRIDLLTVLEHEVGHLLGFDHQETGVMEDTLATGTRKTPTGQWIVQDWALLDLLFAGEQNILRRRFF